MVYKKVTKIYRPRSTRRRTMKRKSLPPRYYYNFKNRINQTKMVSKMLKNVSETKVTPMNKIVEQAASPIQTGAIAHQSCFTVGGVPTQWFGIPGLTGLQGIPAVGTGPNDFNGRTFYWKHSMVSLRITTNATDSPQPLRFRVIVGKPRRQADQSGYTYSPGSFLFLDNTGKPTGPSVLGVNGNDCMMLPLNRRNYDFMRDFQFTLQPPGQPTTQGGDLRPAIQGIYKNDKIMRFKLPYNRKVYLNEDVNGSIVGLPHHWFIYILADTSSRDGLADNWESSVIGTTVFLDN